MLNEYGVSHVFEGLAAQFAALGMSDETTECATFADEERELAGALNRTRAVGPPAPPREPEEHEHDTGKR
jgi:hypothetical protein